MIPSAFDYHAPGTIEEAVALLERHGDEAKVLSGGQSLLPLLKLRLGDAGHLVDIGRIPGLAGITEADGYLRIGGATREADLERSDLIRENYPILLDTAAVIADPLVRNRATVGGNLAHGDPANDHPATMLALEAEVVARGPDGERAPSRSRASSPGSSPRRSRRRRSSPKSGFPSLRREAAAPTSSSSARWATSPPPPRRRRSRSAGRARLRGSGSASPTPARRRSRRPRQKRISWGDGRTRRQSPRPRGWRRTPRHRARTGAGRWSTSATWHAC